jgi:hypothetical protein
MRRLIATISWISAFCCLAPICAAQPAGTPNGSDALNRIAGQIAQYPVIRAEFTQTRQMAAMKRPLVTTGAIVFSRSHGVLWQIAQPYRMSYVLGEDRIVEIGADGARRERAMRDVPGLSQIGRVFRAMLGADAAALRDHFEVDARGDPGKWEIDLKPRDAQLAQFLTGLQLTGGRFVDTIRIGEAGGDSTQIRFRNTQGAAAPDENELRLFGPAPVKR